MILDWETVTDSRSSRFMVKGTVIACCYVPDTMKRFLIEEYRTRGSDGFIGTSYRLRDASTVTLRQVMEGKKSEVIYRSENINDCIEHAMGLV